MVTPDIVAPGVTTKAALLVACVIVAADGAGRLFARRAAQGDAASNVFLNFVFEPAAGALAYFDASRKLPGLLQLPESSVAKSGALKDRWLPQESQRRFREQERLRYLVASPR